MVVVGGSESSGLRALRLLGSALLGRGSCRRLREESRQALGAVGACSVAETITMVLEVSISLRQGYVLRVIHCYIITARHPEASLA